jgi:hypothetical protein
MKKIKLKFLLLLLLPLFFIGCGDDQTPEEEEETVCFEGDIVLLGTNTLPDNARIVTLWYNFSDTIAYLFGDATIDFEAKTFKVCYKESELPEDITLFYPTIYNGSSVSITDYFFSLGSIYVTTNGALANGKYTSSDGNSESILGEYLGLSSDFIVYTANNFRANMDSLILVGEFEEDFLPNFIPGFKQGECFVDGIGLFDEIIPSTRRIKVYIGTEEELESEGVEYCSWT